MLVYNVGKMFSKVGYIELSALCVYFKGFIAKELHCNHLEIHINKVSGKH